MKSAPKPIDLDISTEQASPNHFDIQTVQNTYRRYSCIYDFYFGHFMEKGRKTIINIMDCKPAEEILEVGVGTGLALRFYPSETQVTGIDISKEMLQRAHERKERLQLDHVKELREMDAEKMLFDNASFDKVTAIYVASVVPNPVKLVNEMRRVCRPGGDLYFLNHFHSDSPFIGKIERMLAPFSGILGFRPDLSLEQFIKETDLNVVNTVRTNAFGYWTILHAKNS